MRRSPTQTKVSSKVSETVQVRYLCHVMRQAESSRDTVQRQKNSINQCMELSHVYLGVNEEDFRTELSPAFHPTLHIHNTTHYIISKEYNNNNNNNNNNLRFL